MLVIKARAGLLGLMATLLVSMLVPVAASAEAGPFWYHRAFHGQGKGTKLTGQETEQASGEGGEQKLKTKIAGMAAEIVAKSVQIKGEIYNNSLQGQAKLTLIYHEPKLASAEKEECEVKVGQLNTVRVYADWEWTWDGSAKQLAEQPQQNQKPDLVFWPYQLQEGTKEPASQEFTTITLSPKKAGTCSSFKGEFPIKGNVAAEPKPSNLGEFSTQLTVNTLASEVGQHFWNGTEQVGFTTGLFLGAITNKSNLLGSATVGTSKQQEVTIWPQ